MDPPKKDLLLPSKKEFLNIEMASDAILFPIFEKNKIKNLMERPTIFWLALVSKVSHIKPTTLSWKSHLPSWFKNLG